MTNVLQPFKAVIFDMDGVIVDSEPRHERAFHEVWEAMGYRDRHGINFQDYYGRSDRARADRAVCEPPAPRACPTQA